MADLSHHTQELRRGVGFEGSEVREALRAGLSIAVGALVFYVLASTWVSTCTGSIADAAGCGAPQRAMLMLGTPAILLAGGLWSLMRGFRLSRDQTAWFVTGSVLLGLMVLSVVISLPSLPG